MLYPNWTFPGIFYDQKLNLSTLDGFKVKFDIFLEQTWNSYSNIMLYLENKKISKNIGSDPSGPTALSVISLFWVWKYGHGRTDGHRY